MGKFINIAALTLPACAMLALAQPAAAAEAPATSGAKPAQAAAGVDKAAAPKKYCMNVIPDTGTRIARRQCKTRAEWAELDVQVQTSK